MHYKCCFHPIWKWFTFPDTFYILILVLFLCRPRWSRVNVVFSRSKVRGFKPGWGRWKILSTGLPGGTLSQIFIVHHEYAPRGQTITKEYYRDVLRRLRDAVLRKRPELWSIGNWHLHHDNAPAHSSHLIHTFLVENQTPVVRQVPYFPVLAILRLLVFRCWQFLT